jgi:hypothetical protein
MDRGLVHFRSRLITLSSGCPVTYASFAGQNLLNILGGPALQDTNNYHALMTCVVVFRIYFRRHIATCRVEPFRIVREIRFQGRKHDIIDPAPRPFQVNDFFLVYPVQRFSYGIIIGVVFPVNRPDCSLISASR